METRTIIGIHRMITYSDGAVEVERMPTDFLFDALDLPEIVRDRHISEKIRQIMAVITTVCRKIDRKYEMVNVPVLHRLTTAAFHTVAVEFSVEAPTVADKCCRQLKLTKKMFVEQLYEFLRGTMLAKNYQSSKMYKTIQSNLSVGSDDFDYVKECFEFLCEEEV